MSWRHYEDVSDNIAPGYVKLFLIARFMPCCAPVWMRSARERFLTWRYVEKDYTKDVSEEIAARGNSCILYASCHYIKQIKGLDWYKRFLIRSPFWSLKRYRDNGNVIKKNSRKKKERKIKINRTCITIRQRGVRKIYYENFLFIEVSANVNSCEFEIHFTLRRKRDGENKKIREVHRDNSRQKYQSTFR